MEKSRRRKLIAGTLVGLAVAGGGAAVAATQFTSPSARSQAIVNDAAGQLGIQPEALSNALKKAEENQIDAAVAAGQLSKDQGDRLKQAIESGQVPLVGGGFGLGHGLGLGGGGFGLGRGLGLLGGLDTVASALGLTEAQLRSDLASGKTLAQIATDQGKTADDVVSALMSAATKKLDAAVTAGKLTSAQEQQIESTLKEAITNLVNGTRPSVLPFGFRHGFRGGGGFWNGQGGFPGGPPGGPPSSGSSGSGTIQ